MGVAPSPNADKLLTSCTNFHYTVTERNRDQRSARGTFTATCFGSAAGLGHDPAPPSPASAVNFEASGTANGGGITNCAIALTGTGTLNGQELNLNYSGQTCQGPVSRNEKLRLKT